VTRALLFTGKGGVGKTTTAAATAALAARRGVKTLVLSTDAAHSLADALAVPLGPDPTEIEDGFYGQQVDTQHSFERSWREVRSYLGEVFEAAGVDPVEAEELTVLPGADEVLALLAVYEQLTAGRFDLVVVDCGPTAETLRLLALPEALSWYMRRIFPMERRVVRSLRPVLSRVAGMPMPHDRVFDAVERLHAQLTAVRDALTDPNSAAVRLVTTPESVVIAETRRTLTGLSLYGYRVDAVLANRIMPMPARATKGWQAGWAETHRERLAEIEASFAPLPVLQAPYAPAEPVGVAALSGFAETLYEEHDPTGLAPVTEPLTVERTTDGFALSVALPFAAKEELELTRRGDDIAVTVGAARRLITLPSALRRCDIEGARLDGGRLVVRFVPNPDLWMRS
jgi:arsenite/tail-anchored protein-transporting ATPase